MSDVVCVAMDFVSVFWTWFISMISFSGLDFALCKPFPTLFSIFLLTVSSAREVISISAFVLIFLTRILLQLMVCRHFTSLLFKTFDHFFAYRCFSLKTPEWPVLATWIATSSGRGVHVKKNEAIFASVNLYAFFPAESLPVAWFVQFSHLSSQSDFSSYQLLFGCAHYTSQF